MCYLTCISITFTESWNHSSVDPAERDKLGPPSAKHATNHNAHAFNNCFNQYLQILSAHNQCFKNWTGPAGSTWSDWNGHLHCTRLLGPFPHIHWLLAGQKTAATSISDWGLAMGCKPAATCRYDCLLLLRLLLCFYMVISIQCLHPHSTRSC